MNQADYFRTNPPRCISGFVTTAIGLPSDEFDGHAAMSQPKASTQIRIESPDYINTVYSLSCQCKNIRFYVHCFLWLDPDGNHRDRVVLSPLVLECDACRKMTDLFDSKEHGYESEVGLRSCNMRAAGDQVVFECPNCGKQPLHIIVRFEFSDDLFNQCIPETSGREKELFSWFSVRGTCSRCTQLIDVADFECA